MIMAEVTKPIILDETGQGIKTVIAEVKTAIDNQSTKMETALSEVKTAIENHSGGGSSGSADAVLYTEQTLTDEQKAQARENIGVSDYSAYTTDRTVSMLGGNEISKVYALYDALMAENTDRITKQSIGQDSGGNHIYEYTITMGDYNSKNGVRGQDAVIRKPVFLLVTGVHGGKEQPAMFSVYQFCRDFAAGNGTLAALFGGATFKVLPAAVPVAYVRGRKTNANDVNINRNFDVKWTHNEDFDSGNYSGASPADQVETQVLQSWLQSNTDAFMCFDIHNAAVDKEVSMVVGNYESAEVMRMKKRYLLGIDNVIPFWRNERNFPADSLFSYTGTVDLGGLLIDYAQSIGINSLALEVHWNQNNTGIGSTETVAVGAEAIGNTLLSIYKSIEEVETANGIAEAFFASLTNAEEVLY